MAGISFNFRNIVGSKKCAVSSPRIVSLETGDESPGSASESVFQGIFLNDQVCRNDVKNNSSFICGCDKRSDNFLIHSQSPLSTSTCDDRPSDEIKSTNDSDIDLDLLDLLNSTDLEGAVDSGAGNFKSKKTASYDKMKIISNVEVCDGLSDLLLSTAHDISEKDEGGSTFEYCQRKNTRDCDIGLLDFEIVKNECADSVSSNNSSLKVEGNMSDLLSSINIEDSDVTKVGTKVANKFEMENEPPVADLFDLLSSIDLGDSNDNKVGSCNRGNIEALDVKNESCLADLSSIDIDKSNKSASSILNSKPISFGSSNLYFKDTNGISDSLNDFTFDIGSSSSSSNSSASSYSEKENSSPKNSSTKNNLLTDKVFESDSGYSSFDSAHKGFSFFDYSSDNQFSFNTLLSKKSDASIAVKHSDSEDARNDNEEMSMSDLMTIVSQEFKNPVLASLNKAEKRNGSVFKDSSSMQDFVECLNINDSHVVRNNSIECDEKLMNYDCIDGRTSENIQSGIETIGIYGDTLLGEDDISISRSDFVNDDEQITLIDLRECIKSAEHQFPPTSPIKQYTSVENQSLECFSPNKILFYCGDKLPSDSSQDTSNLFEFNDVVPSKKSRVNTKQTLFSKALACKPKKDHSLLQKVANIKNELLNNIIHRPVFIDCDLPQPIVESVQQSDRCILSNVGRRSFGLDAPCELQ
ncbi:hypothetical protein AVEN_118283-1 [Araneus ventricosus]|uniref:Uncharacterized protein n=1 Tax=Araneus ventricosus TaxID=182803 RepID=A0A4Y2DZF3_ARAVE|nr:hypothetical protein AVEN_118283-1 [Araneus ventricosus]